MKLRWIAAGAALLVGLWATKSMARGSYEQPTYTVEKETKTFEVRRYQPYLTATVRSAGSGSRFDEGMNTTFMKLAGYIFGKNSTGEKIAMTSPVEFQKDEGEAEMSFMLPSGYKLGDLPTPEDADITFHQQPERTVAALRFSGYISDKLWNQKKSELLKAVGESREYEVVGEPFYFGYDPPGVPGPLRRNEVLVELKSLR